MLNTTMTQPSRSTSFFRRRTVQFLAAAVVAVAIAVGTFFAVHAHGGAQAAHRSSGQQPTQSQSAGKQTVPVNSGKQSATQAHSTSSQSEINCNQNVDPSSKRTVTVLGRAVTVCPPSQKAN